MTASVRLGLFASLAAYTAWGFLPLYFRVLDHIPPDEMLAHRIIWSLVTGFVLLTVAQRWNELVNSLTLKKLFWLTISALLIGLNWLTYIWSVDQNRVMETSIGYYTNPLLNVIIGAFFFRDRLRIGQWSAFAIASVGVIVVAFAYGSIPWIVIILCFSFSAYSVIRKQIIIDGRVGFTVEAAILVPLALLWLSWFVGQPNGRLIGEGGMDIPLLIASGPITAFPLIMFAISAKRLKLSTIGMLQFLGPTIQFLIAVLIFRENFGGLHFLAFMFIWSALIIFSIDSMIAEREANRLERQGISQINKKAQEG